MQTYEDKFENVKYFYSLLKWFNVQTTEVSFKNLGNTINNLSRNKKMNSLMHLYFIDRLVIPHDFNVYSIISECTSSDLSSLELISGYKKKYKESKIFFRFQSEIISFFQLIFMKLGFYLRETEKFVSSIDNYFSSLREKSHDSNEISIEYFGFCTLPSIFGFFSIPDLLQYAYQISLSLISKDSLKVLSDYFSASFFFSSSSFFNFLWDDYLHRFLTTKIRYSPFKYFEFFLKSLRKASNFLLYYHYKIAEKLFSVSHERFLNVMIKLLFLPTLEIRIISDSAAHIYEIDQISCLVSLKYAFKFILENPSISFSTSILNALKIKVDSAPSIQHVYCFNVKKFYCYISMKEIILLANILTGYEGELNNVLFKHHSFPDFVTNNNSIFYYEFYFFNQAKNDDSSHDENVYRNNKLFLPNIKKIEINSNDDFSRKFLEFQNHLREKSINIVSIIDDRFPTSPEDQPFVKYFRKCNKIIENDDFKDYVITRVFNHYCDLFDNFEKQMIVENMIQTNYKENHHALNRLYFMYLNAFIPFDDCFSTKSLRYKLISLPNIREDAYDDVIKFLVAYTTQYNDFIYGKFINSAKRINRQSDNESSENNNENNNENSNSEIYEIESDTDSSFNIFNAADGTTNSIFDFEVFKDLKFSNNRTAIKHIQALKNMCKFVIKMDICDKIIIYTKIFRGIHELIISQNIYPFFKDNNVSFDDDEDYNRFFMSLIMYLFNNIKILLNLYETYCTFFKYAFTQFEEAEDEEMIEVKEEWIRFQNVLKQTILKGDKKHLEICLLK